PYRRLKGRMGNQGAVDQAGKIVHTSPLLDGDRKDIHLRGAFFEGFPRVLCGGLDRGWQSLAWNRTAVPLCLTASRLGISPTGDPLVGPLPLQLRFTLYNLHDLRFGLQPSVGT